MLKEKALKKIFITTITIFIVLVFYTLANLGEPKSITKDISLVDQDDLKTIYTINTDNYIAKATVYIDSKLSLEDKIKSLLEIMIEKNNKNALLPSNFKPILPKNTKVLSVKLDNDILKINFSKELKNINKEQEEQMLEAITYTLTEFKDVLGVEIYVEGNLIKYNSNNVISTILTKDIGINKIYDLTNTNNINKVILHYYSKKDGKLYDIPITKYINDDREKIEIIVEELANNYIKEPNLISYLDSRTKLLNYNIKDKTLNMTFNDYLFSTNDKGLEALYKSIFNNYDINKIKITNKTGKIIEKSK